MSEIPTPLIPAQAGIQGQNTGSVRSLWIPACAGMSG